MLLPLTAEEAKVPWLYLPQMDGPQWTSCGYPAGQEAEAPSIPEAQPGVGQVFAQVRSSKKLGPIAPHTAQNQSELWAEQCGMCTRG